MLSALAGFLPLAPPTFASRLPYWAVRTVTSSQGHPFAVVLHLDGTMALGFRVHGVDLYAAPNTRLNMTAVAIRSALNLLPETAYLQADWTTGISSEELINDFAHRGQNGHDVISAQRQEKLEVLRGSSFVRGGLTLWLGGRRALGRVTPDGESALVRALFSGGRKTKTRSEVTWDDVVLAAQSLEEQLQPVTERLSSAGLRFEALDERQIVEALHQALNPRSGQIPPPSLIDQRELYTDAELEVLKPHTLREALPLSDFVNEFDHYIVDGEYRRALTLHRLPQLTSPDFMSGLQFATRTPFQISVAALSTNREQVTDALRLRQRRMHAMAQGNVRDVQADVALAEYDELLSSMLSADERVFKLAFTVTPRAPSLHELDRATLELRNAFAALGIVLTVPAGAQLQSAFPTLPAAGYTAPRTQEVVSSNVADLLPVTRPSEGDPEAQLLFETRQGTPRAMSLVSKKKINQNVIVLGASGSGKSFTVANIFEQAVLAEGAPVLVVDVQGPEVSNYRILADVLDGQYTALASSEDIAFNPFYAHDALTIPGSTPPRIDEGKVSNLCKLVSIMALPSSTKEELAFSMEIGREAILKAYKATRGKGRPPLIRDVVEQLSLYEPKEPAYGPLAERMRLNLKTWTTTPTRARLLDRASNATTEELLQVFDFHGLEKDPELATVLLLSVAFRIWETLERYPRDLPKTIIFDEVWALLRHPVATDIARELFKTARKWGGSVWAITQDLSDFQKSDAADALLANSQTVILTKHNQGHDDVADLLQLNARERHLFGTLEISPGRYAELLLLDRDIRSASVVRLRPTPFDLWLNTSNPRDVAFRSRVMTERGMSYLDAMDFCAKHHPTGAP